MKLVRYNTTYSGKQMVSLDDYISHMKEGQEKIYFIVSTSPENAMVSPFMEPVKGTDVPVLILLNSYDEVCLKNTGQYKNKLFVNLESSFEQISKDLGK